MPILPIDLQTMFSNLNQVSKEQSLQKQEQPNQQALQGLHIVKESEEKDKNVNQPDDVDEGPDKVNNKEKKKGRKERRKKSKQSESDDIKDDVEVVKDPLLGHHVDVSG